MLDRAASSSSAHVGMEKYEQLELIGRGNYGTAHLVTDKDTGARLVVKKIQLGVLTENEREDAQKEYKVLASLDHPNILRYVDSFVEADTLHIVTHYCNGGDLAARIKEQKERKEFFTEDYILKLFVQIAMAVDHIHRNNIMHRDLKTGNVFLTTKGTVMLGDFGIAKKLDSTLEQAQTVIGTPFYMSPELCENKPYDFKSDMWALGCILYELCALSHAFYARNLLKLVLMIVKKDPHPIPSHYSDSLKGLIKKLLSKDPKNRPLTPQLFGMPIINERLELIASLGANVGAFENPFTGGGQSISTVGSQSQLAQGSVGTSTSTPLQVGDFSPPQISKSKSLDSSPRSQALLAAASQDVQASHPMPHDLPKRSSSMKDKLPQPQLASRHGISQRDAGQGNAGKKLEKRRSSTSRTSRTTMEPNFPPSQTNALPPQPKQRLSSEQHPFRFGKFHNTSSQELENSCASAFTAMSGSGGSIRGGLFFNSVGTGEMRTSTEQRGSHNGSWNGVVANGRPKHGRSTSMVDQPMSREMHKEEKERRQLETTKVLEAACVQNLTETKLQRRRNSKVFHPSSSHVPAMTEQSKKIIEENELLERQLHRRGSSLQQDTTDNEEYAGTPRPSSRTSNMTPSNVMRTQSTGSGGMFQPTFNEDTNHYNCLQKQNGEWHRSNSALSMRRQSRTDSIDDLGHQSDSPVLYPQFTSSPTMRGTNNFMDTNPTQSGRLSGTHRTGSNMNLRQSVLLDGNTGGRIPGSRYHPDHEQGARSPSRVVTRRSSIHGYGRIAATDPGRSYSPRRMQYSLARQQSDPLITSPRRMSRNLSAQTPTVNDTILEQPPRISNSSTSLNHEDRPILSSGRYNIDEDLPTTQQAPSQYEKLTEIDPRSTKLLGRPHADSSSPEMFGNGYAVGLDQYGTRLSDTPPFTANGDLNGTQEYPDDFESDRSSNEDGDIEVAGHSNLHPPRLHHRSQSVKLVKGMSRLSLNRQSIDSNDGRPTRLRRGHSRHKSTPDGAYLTSYSSSVRENQGHHRGNSTTDKYIWSQQTNSELNGSGRSLSSGGNSSGRLTAGHVIRSESSESHGRSGSQFVSDPYTSPAVPPSRYGTHQQVRRRNTVLGVKSVGDTTASPIASQQLHASQIQREGTTSPSKATHTRGYSDRYNDGELRTNESSSRLKTFEAGNRVEDGGVKVHEQSENIQKQPGMSDELHHSAGPKWEQYSHQCRENLIRVLGQSTFEQLYSYLRQCHANKVDFEHTKKELGNLVGESNLDQCYNADILIWIEETYLKPQRAQETT